MEFITVKEAAEKWQVSARRVQILCSSDRIKGAYRFGKSWMIPSSAVLPNARRKEEEPQLPMPRKSPFLDMTNLYNKEGCADECAEMLVNQPEAHALFEAQIAYRRGEIEKAIKMRLTAAMMGSARAEYMLGCHFEYGDGLPCNPEKAKYYYKKAREHGFRDVLFEMKLGFLREKRLLELERKQ